MSQLKHLLEKATQKNEMKWRVYAYDPAKDNKLVHTSELFDDINGAGIEKAEWLKKHPEHTIEIIAEAVAKARIDIGNDDIDDAYMDVNYAISRDTNYKLKDFKKEAVDIDVKNPGVLEVPDGKKVDELPQSHFEKLVDKKGYAEVIRALTNLEVWNKDKNKSLSSWASNMADKLKKKFRPESAQKNEAFPPNYWADKAIPLEYTASVEAHGSLEIMHDKEDDTWRLNAIYGDYKDILVKLLNKPYKTSEEARQAVEKQLKGKIRSLKKLDIKLGKEHS